MTTRISLALFAIALASAANANLIQNGSFELGSFSPDGNNAMSLNPGATNITGWTIVNGETAWIHNNNGFNNLSASDGVMHLDLTGYHDGLPFARLQQTIQTSVGQQYVLTFDQGIQSQYSVTSSVLAIAGAFSQNFTESDSSGNMTWRHQQLVFTAQSTQTLISLEGSLPTTGTYIGIDNVAVNPVPEPASMTALALGAVALLRRRRNSSRR